VTDAELLAEIEDVIGEQPKTSRTEALRRGAVQGVMLGHGEEIEGAIRALKGKKLPQDVTAPGPLKLSRMFPGVPYPQARMKWMEQFGRPEDVNRAAAETARHEQEQKYRGERDVLRSENERARAERPGWYTAGEFAGAAPVYAATGGSAAAVAGQGALQGAGSATSDDPTELLGDSALGAAGGLLGFGAGKALGKGAAAVERSARGRLARALAKATAEKAAERASAVQSAAGSLGGARAEANRVVEAIRGLLSDPNLDAAGRATLKRLEGTPEYTQALSTLVQSLEKRLPDVAGKVAQGEAGVAAANALPSVPQLAAERVSGKAAREKVMDRLTRYGPPMLGSAVGAMLGDAPGAMVGSLAGAGMRPSARAMIRMLRDPAVQTQIMSPVAKSAGAAASPVGRRLTQSLARAAGISAAPGLSESLSGQSEAEAEAELQRLLEGE
jgi:hypothetical protein